MLSILAANILFFLSISGNVDAAGPGYTVFGNLSYGPHSQQTVDIYLPKVQHGIDNSSTEWTSITKTIIMIHGGGWASGRKENMNSLLWMFATGCPSCAILNMNYRLGTAQNPGYPKQLDDVGLVVDFVKSQGNGNMSFALAGGSAGGHLSLLYGYKNPSIVKAIVNIVGPTDLTDPNIAFNPYMNFIISSLVGNCIYCNCPELYNETSPATWITPEAPKTISFFGNKDPLIPTTQSEILETKLNAAGVYNEMTIYNGGHFNWTKADLGDMVKKTVKFLQTYF